MDIEGLAPVVGEEQFQGPFHRWKGDLLPGDLIKPEQSGFFWLIRRGIFSSFSEELGSILDIFFDRK